MHLVIHAADVLFVAAAAGPCVLYLMSMILVVWFVPCLLIAFWLWMFNDMLHNDELPTAGTPGLRWPPETKNHWTILFVCLNIFTAGYYYFIQYKNRRRL